ncbi:MAG: ABC transporter ATP-binding protein/permease [Coriobacteriales bacterium]|jgi:ABC-type lipoprotein export system ATPase subunit/ABC-type antimicrobial peptide transport system permease subunit|nr:ABC transporter ATP-binding protein/permease [Coriobacteriales bacterium]
MLQLAEVRKAYKTAGFEQVALDNVDIAFRDNEFVAILGPSGSGKTTLLNIVGGLDHYDSGDLIIDGISTKRYRDRDWDTYRNNRIGFVFQSYNLIPHQSVLVNVELALTLSGVSKAQRRRRAIEALEEVGLAEHIHKKPNQLSGGQMQRVAIARALINDPEIVLADEPTGALDSKTSVQIMGLLTEIAKNRLVIMVTHNPELAARYANRIVNLYDGHIQADSNPFVPTIEDVAGKEKQTRRTSMSFLTAIALSFTNLMTKKGRTIMTAFAGSIGIIGIAAILSLANGVNSYIKDVEENLLTVYPLSIRGTGMDLTAMLSSSLGSGSGSSTSGSGSDGGSGSGSGSASNSGANDATQQVNIRETKSIVSMFSSIGQNDLAALKTYFDANGGGVNEYVNSIEYSYDITPQIFSSDTSRGPIQVNPDILTRTMGIDTGGGFGQFMSMGMNTTVFSPLIENTRLLVDQYDVVAGRWPESYNECVVVLDYRGGINDYMLYMMGLRDPKELDEMIKQFNNNEDVTTPEDVFEFTGEDILDVTFKLVSASDFYTRDETYGVWTDRRSDEKYMKELVDKGETLSIVGVLRENPDATATSLTPGIYYPSSLTLHLMEKAAQARIVKDQLADRNVNVFTGKTFEEEMENSAFDDFALTDLMTIDEEAMRNAFSIDNSMLNIDLSGVMNPNALYANLPSMPTLDLADFISTANIDVPTDALAPLASEVLGQYLMYAFANGLTTPDEIINGFADYLAIPEVRAQLEIKINEAIDVEDIQNEVQQAFAEYMQTMMQGYITAVMTTMQRQITNGMSAAMAQMSANMANAMHIDQEAFANAFQFNMSEEELSQLMMAMMSSESNTYDNNLRHLGYAEVSRPSGINVYPIDFENKQKVIDILTSYNEEKTDQGKEDQVITYNDIVGLLMTSVTDIINMISYVLVAFVAISLVVSSIMIGVITYISVLERRKEIGILRAIGARKRDIGNVFNAETLIVGFTAGVMGILITLALSIPANIIVASTFGVQNIAILPLAPALALVFISMGLTFVAGLIPSSAASRRDPVEALRSE